MRKALGNLFLAQIWHSLQTLNNRVKEDKHLLRNQKMGQLLTQRRIEVFFFNSLCEVDKTDVLHINRWRIKEIKKIGQPLLKKGPIDKSFPKKMQKRKIYCSHLLAHCQLDSFNLLRSVLVVIFFIFNFLIFNFFIFLPCGNGTCSLLKAILTAPLLFGFPPAFEYIGIIMMVQMGEGCTIILPKYKRCWMPTFGTRLKNKISFLAFRVLFSSIGSSCKIISLNSFDCISPV